MKPRYTESVSFLKRWAPEGPWVLSAILPGVKRKLTTRTFNADQETEVRKWLTEHGKTSNLYFSVNPTRYPVSKKAERVDIAALLWIHVDVDPRAGEDLAEEQARIRRIFTEELPQGVPEPTCVVFSGGGYQGFWRISNPFEIDGDLAKAEAAKLYNLQIEQLFEADACHNVDRIMRLPGTINRPDERKRAKGRTEALAEVVFFNGNTFELDADFIPAVPVQTKGETGFSNGSAAEVEVSGNVRRLESLDELGSDVSGYCKQVITQGNDPDDPGKWSSRSDVVWYVTCELVRSGVDDETIFSILTDPGFQVSAHVLDQNNPKRAALRTIGRAKENAIAPELAELNTMHAVIRDYGGACRIITELPVVIGGTTRTEITAQSFADFLKWYSNRRIEFPNPKGKVPISVPLGKWWTEHPDRRQHDRVVFSPEVDVPGAYNLWRGFAYQSRPGTCDLFLNHVRDNVCSGDAEHFAYLMGWMATTVQKPASQGHTAIVLRGTQGTGKSFFAKTFGKLFGRHFLQVSDPKHLVGSFNAHLRDCLVLFGDEAFYAGDKKHESVLKMLVTEETLTIEAKGVDVTTEANFVHLIMASNDTWVVPAGSDERRFFVLDVSADQKQKGAYFAAIQAELNAGGYEALLHTLRTWDLKGFDVRTVPRTQALQEQQRMSMTTEEDWWFQKLMSGSIAQGLGWPEQIIRDHLRDDYADFFKDFGRGPKKGPEALGIFLRTKFPEKWSPVGRFNDTRIYRFNGQDKTVVRPMTYPLPSVEECRRVWDESTGTKTKWPPVPTPPSDENLTQDVPF